jgi:hypothetical protein
MESTGLFLTLGILFVLWLVVVGLSTGARSARIAAHRHHIAGHSIPPVSQSDLGSSAQRGLATGVLDHLGTLFGPLSAYLERIRKAHGKEKRGDTRPF